MVCIKSAEVRTSVKDRFNPVNRRAHFSRNVFAKKWII